MGMKIENRDKEAPVDADEWSAAMSNIMLAMASTRGMLPIFEVGSCRSRSAKTGSFEAYAGGRSTTISWDWN